MLSINILSAGSSRSTFLNPAARRASLAFSPDLSETSRSDDLPPARTAMRRFLSIAWVCIVPPLNSKKDLIHDVLLRISRLPAPFISQRYFIVEITLFCSVLKGASWSRLSVNGIFVILPMPNSPRLSRHAVSPHFALSSCMNGFLLRTYVRLMK